MHPRHRAGILTVMSSLKRNQGDGMERDPLVRPASPGESQERVNADLEQKSWREKYPGWETYEGRPNDPRFQTTESPNSDLRYDTNLNPEASIPRQIGPLVVVLGAFLGVVLFALLIYFMYWHFQRPSPRSPGVRQSSIEQPVRPSEAALADNPLRWPRSEVEHPSHVVDPRI